jgi:lysophospholipase L1-like esterase
MKARLFIAFFALLCIFRTTDSFSQKKIVVMGSSTAAGNGASTPQNSFVNKLQAYFQRNMSDGLDTVIYNIATSGYNTYLEMPTGFVPPAGRPAPDPTYNVTRALSYNPDVVLINLPSNDIASGYTKKECMDNLRLMFSTINATGAKCFITTTQPRNLDPTSRQYQRDLVDSINNNFGIRSINFWTDLVNPLTDANNIYTINPPVSAGDGIHVNDAGHEFLFQRVKNTQLFAAGIPLPLSLTDFTALPKNNAIVLSWHTEQEDPNTFFEIQRSSDGINYKPLVQITARGNNQPNDYTWTDQQPLANKSFYRIKIIENNQEKYSKVINITGKESAININKVYTDNSSSKLITDISIEKSQTVVLSIINITGAVVYQQSQYVAAPSKTLELPIDKLNSGEYFLRIQTADNNKAVIGFIK